MRCDLWGQPVTYNGRHPCLKLARCLDARELDSSCDGSGAEYNATQRETLVTKCIVPQGLIVKGQGFAQERSVIIFNYWTILPLIAHPLFYKALTLGPICPHQQQYKHQISPVFYPAKYSTSNSKLILYISHDIG
ncbi:hypothetical protein HI914_07093 [Erysiphe necator]|nr:hypothetical protein HI914_07093 [Erysiphe necator]